MEGRLLNGKKYYSFDSNIFSVQAKAGNILSLNINNLLNERYEKPATYSQDGRMLSLGFRLSLIHI